MASSLSDPVPAPVSPAQDTPYHLSTHLQGPPQVRSSTLGPVMGVGATGTEQERELREEGVSTHVVFKMGGSGDLRTPPGTPSWFLALPAPMRPVSTRGS